MQALQNKFFKEPEFPELEQGIAELHNELTQRMDREERKKLLRLFDMTGELQCRITQAGFVAGFRLASGIAKELSLEEPYSFDKDEEQQVSQRSVLPLKL